MVDGTKAWKNLEKYDPLQYLGSCLYYCSKAYDDAGATYDGSYATAYDAAMAVPSSQRHYDENPPYGAAIYLGRRHSDGNMAGDVFIAGPDSSSHNATDQPSWGTVGECSVQARKNLTDREYLFWAPYIMGAQIDVSGNEPPEEDEVKIKNVAMKYKDGQVVATEQYIYVDTDKAVTVIQGPATVVNANLYVAFSVEREPDDPAAAVQITPVIEVPDGNGWKVASNLGTQEIPFTTGSTFAHVPVPPCNLADSNHRLRFQINVSNNAKVKLGTGTMCRIAYTN